MLLLYKNSLTKKFFEDNPVKNLTAQQFVYAQIQVPIMSEFVSDFVRKYDNRADEERKKLLHENDPDVLLKMLRGKCDVINHHLLHQRILTHEEIVLPKILEMFKTSLNSVFIENTVKILANTKKDYSEALLKILDEIRSTYAMSLACITLGFIADEETIPVLMKKFLYFRKLYPEENYDQGPLHGLIKLYERFYQQQ